MTSFRQRLALPIAALALFAGTALAAAARAEQFTLMMYESDAEFAARTDQEQGPAYWGSWGAYAKAMQDAGILRGGSPLQTAAHTTTVTLKQGKPSATTGAAATASTQLSGYFLIEVADLDTAVAWAAKAPSAATNAVEIRPAYPAPKM